MNSYKTNSFDFTFKCVLFKNIKEFFNLHFKYYLNNLFNLSYYACLQDSVFEALKIRVLFTTTNRNSINFSFHFIHEKIEQTKDIENKRYRKDWLISRLLMHRSSLRQIQIILRRQNFLSFSIGWPKQNSRKNKSFSRGSKKPEILKGLNRRKDRSMDGRERRKMDEEKRQRAKTKVAIRLICRWKGENLDLSERFRSGAVRKTRKKAPREREKILWQSH